MSEEAGLEGSGTELEGGSDAAVTDAEDQEAADLLGGMMDNDPETLAEQVKHWQAQARKWEGRSKANSTAADELKQIKQSQMSELEKAQAMAADAARERDEALATHHRVMAAAAHNLPVELIDHLGSGTEDEINERAELWSGVIQAAAEQLANQILAEQAAGRNGQQFTGARPVTSMRAGSAPASGGTPTTPDEYFRALLNSRNE